jgi:hypothetical protein
MELDSEQLMTVSSCITPAVADAVDALAAPAPSPAATAAAAAPTLATRPSRVPVVRVAPHLVFGVKSGWCIVTCPVCDRDGAGFVQEDVHELSSATCTHCAYDHEYHIEVETVQQDT